MKVLLDVDFFLIDGLTELLCSVAESSAAAIESSQRNCKSLCGRPSIITEEECGDHCIVIEEP
jgi:hypothetical protein